MRRACAARPTAKSDSPIGGATRRSSGSAHGATSCSNSRTCPEVCSVVLADVRVVHPPEQADRVGVAQRHEIEAGRVEGARAACASSSGDDGRARRRAVRRPPGPPARRSAPVPPVGATSSRNSRSARMSSSMCSSTLTQTIVSKRWLTSLVAVAFLEVADAQRDLRVAVERGAGARRRSSGSARCRPGGRRSPRAAGWWCRCRSRLRARCEPMCGRSSSKTCAWYRFASLIVSRSSAAYCFWVCVNRWSTFMSECGASTRYHMLSSVRHRDVHILTAVLWRPLWLAAAPAAVAPRRRRLRPDRGGADADQGRRRRQRAGRQTG